MADVGSVTNFNANLPNPLAQLSGIMSIANTAQQNQLLQTANQQRMFELHKQKNDAINSIIGPLSTVDGLDSKQAQQVILPQLRALGLDPATSPEAAQHVGPLLDGSLDNPKAMKLWQAGHAATFLGGQGFVPTTGPATNQGAPTTTLPIERAAMKGPQATQFGPSAQAAAGAYGGQVGGAAAGASVAENTYRQQVTPLEIAIPALERLGTTGTGPGKDEINQMKSAAISFGFAPTGWVDDVKHFDEAKKYLSDWVRRNGDTSSNERLYASMASNPSVNISNAAAQDVAKTALALRRAQFMQQQAFANSGQTPDQYSNFVNKWNAQHDPRAFGFDQMTLAQRKAVMKTVKNPAQFKQDVVDADQANVLNRPPPQ